MQHDHARGKAVPRRGRGESDRHRPLRSTDARPLADVDFLSSTLPPAPVREPTSNVLFTLREDVVDVYLAPNLDGGFY